MNPEYPLDNNGHDEQYEGIESAHGAYLRYRGEYECLRCEKSGSHIATFTDNAVSDVSSRSCSKKEMGFLLYDNQDEQSECCPCPNICEKSGCIDILYSIHEFEQIRFRSIICYPEDEYTEYFHRDFFLESFRIPLDSKSDPAKDEKKDAENLQYRKGCMYQKDIYQ